MSFIVQIKIGNIYNNIAEDVKTKFGTSNFEIDRPLPKGKSKKSNWTYETWNTWKNHERICVIKSKNIQLFKKITMMKEKKQMAQKIAS